MVYVVLLRDRGAKSLSLFDLRQELQVFLRSDYFEIRRLWATTKGSVSFWGLSANLVLIGMMLRSKHLPTSHLRPSSRSLFSAPRASQGHLQGLQLLRVGVRTQAQGSRCRGVRGALGVRLQRRLRRRCASAPAAREPAASSSGTSTAAEALRRRPEPGVADDWSPCCIGTTPSPHRGSRGPLPTPPTSLIKASLLWPEDSRRLSGAVQAVQ